MLQNLKQLFYKSMVIIVWSETVRSDLRSTAYPKIFHAKQIQNISELNAKRKSLASL